MASEEVELVGHGGGGHGGGHGGFHGGHRGGGFVGPWFGPYLDWDEDSLYANPELSTDEIRLILETREAREAKQASAKVGHRFEGSGLDCLGAVTFTGEDWATVLKGALSSLASDGGGDKAKAEAKAKAEKEAAAASATRWKWAAGIGAALGVFGLIVFGRKAS
jgi:hypothetical protein